MEPRTQIALPRSFLLGLVVATVGPCLFSRVLPWSEPAVEQPLSALMALSALEADQELFWHTILQWTGVCIALLTAVCAFSLYAIRRDLATPIVGSALLFAGLMDAFHTLAADRLIATVADPDRFIPFTWALSRIFHAGIVAVGTLPFVWSSRFEARLDQGRRSSLLLTGSIFALGTFLLVQVCAQVSDLPTALTPQGSVARPWDAIALIVYLFAGGILLPRFYHRHPTLFAYGLLLSLIPHTLGELYAAFGSRQVFDDPFFVAQQLKLVGYAVPLAGLLVDFTRVYQLEAELRSTQEKLRVAREIQRGLLPSAPPSCPGYDLGGLSIPCDAVGGDLFDYLSLANGRLGLLIADVSGHDLGAAILMSQTRAYLRALARHASDPAVLLAQLNTFLCRDVRDRRFVTCFLAVLDPSQHRLVYAAAGECGHVFRRAAGTWETLPPTGVVLGVTESIYTNGPEITLAHGDLLLIATDGWSEAVATNGEAFGTGRVTEFVQTHADQPAAEILSGLHQSLRTFREEEPAADDLTAILLARLAETHP